MMQSFIDQLTDTPGISPEQISIIKEGISVKKVAKGDVLMEKGDLMAKSYFVIKGCLRSFFIDNKGKEHIYMFAPEGWIIGDIEAHVNKTPAELYIDALEDSEIEVIDAALLDKINFGQFPGTKAGVEKLMKRISVLQKRVIMLMSATAMDRYKYFIDIYPNIVQRVPQKMIASYLGITPEALSRIKHEIARPKKKIKV